MYASAKFGTGCTMLWDRIEKGPVFRPPLFENLIGNYYGHNEIAIICTSYHFHCTLVPSDEIFEMAPIRSDLQWVIYSCQTWRGPLTCCGCR